MPSHAYTMLAGSRARSVLAYGRTDEGPLVGLRADSTGLIAAYGRDDGVVAQISFRTYEDSGDALGVFTEVDPLLLPGVYRLVLPDDALGQGATRVIVVIQAPIGRFDPIEIDLVAFDQQDAYSLGMVALTRTARMACLSGAFPRLAALERGHSEEAHT